MMMDEIEMLARMWIECDPNRGGPPGSGFGADDHMPDMSGDLKDKPRWHWFIPRAEATAAYIRAKGFVLAPSEETRWIANLEQQAPEVDEIEMEFLRQLRSLKD